MKLQGAECFVGGWGSKKCNDIFKNSSSTHTKDWGRGGNDKGVLLVISKLYEIARCRCVGDEGNIKRPFFLSFTLFFFCFVDTNEKSTAIIQFTQGKRVAPTPETHKSNQWKSNHGG